MKLLPALTPELFVAAGALVAEHLTLEGASIALVAEVVQRVVDHCQAIAR